ncbi:MAG: 3-deoxy-D-manno-octulosonic acid transferase, partial [Methyloligellaceae bacterium]
PDLSQLLTTGTVTSAKLAEQRIPEGSIHQYAPVDAPKFVRGFMQHWKPDIAFFTESEIWPNLVTQASELRIPLILLNGIMSNKSFRRWKKRPTMARTLFSRYSLILAQNPMMKKRFDRLGARGADVIGNLKMDAPLLPVNQSELDKLRNALNGRPVFLAASTHTGEEEIIARAHKMLRDNIPGLLTVIAPRHPERGAEIKSSLQEMGLNVPMRSAGEKIEEETDIYLANTIGELGIFFSLSPLAFMGGSLITHGGQNPIEAIKLGTCVVTGPNWNNFNDSYKELFKLNGAREIISAETLSAVVQELLQDKEKLQLMNRKAQEAVANLSGALDRTIEAITPYLPPETEKSDDSSRLRRVS